jgi:hypothetical protein
VTPRSGPRLVTEGQDQVAVEGTDRNQHNALGSRMDGASLLPAALAYAARGWAVFPLYSAMRGRCTCGRGDCSSPGKHPRTTRGLHDATTDAEQLAAWWRRRPSSNIGIATGAASGIFVVDVDRIEALEELRRDHGLLPETLEQRTGSGGRHLVFRYPAGIKIGNRAGLLEGLDARGDGGYIVAPPSTHISGHRYIWRNRLRVASAPTWLVDLVRPRPQPARAVAPAARYLVARLGTPWGEAVLEGELKTLVDASQGERNHSLFRAACNVFEAALGGQLDAEAARRSLEHAALSIGLSATEIRRTLDSAYRRAEPRAPQPTGRRL